MPREITFHHTIEYVIPCRRRLAAVDAIEIFLRVLTKIFDGLSDVGYNKAIMRRQRRRKGICKRALTSHDC